MNDSAWYYMNVHFFNTGNYIHESAYPSFHQASQYYPFFGYSFFLYLCERISSLLNLDWSTPVKLIQFILYLLSAFMAGGITFLLTRKQKLSYLIVVVYLLYYPYFNTCNFVMSETYACFFSVLIVFLFLKTQANYNKWISFILFLSCGYSILVKPVFLFIVIPVMVLYALQSIRFKEYSRLLALSAVLLFPFLQSGYSKVHHNNYSLQTGLGWHLWDRVIQSDKLIPHDSEKLEELKKVYRSHGREPNFGFWWDITRDLSEFSYEEKKIQDICKNIALDGIREYPREYIINTFSNSAKTFLEHPANNQVYPTTHDYKLMLANFSNEPQHIPLTDHLKTQVIFVSTKSFFSELIMKLNHRISGFRDPVNLIIHNLFFLIIYLAAGTFYLVQMFMSGFRNKVNESFIWLVPFFIVVGSNMLEYDQPRFLLPGFIFVVISIVNFMSDFIRILKHIKKTELP
ncbi:MAG: hypothetical protein K0Q95_2022 [Bacteroidota bacterium]|nr:hypothetical protein [Bacteroidota bacterium]